MINPGLPKEYFMRKVSVTTVTFGCCYKQKWKELRLKSKIGENIISFKIFFFFIFPGDNFKRLLPSFSVFQPSSGAWPKTNICCCRPSTGRAVPHSFKDFRFNLRLTAPIDPRIGQQMSKFYCEWNLFLSLHKSSAAGTMKCMVPNVFPMSVSIKK